MKEAGSQIRFAFVQRRHLRGLIRNVECLRDVLVLVGRSEKLLQLVREKGEEALRENDDGGLMTKLGWFESRDGDMRWGIELVETRTP